MTTYLLALDVDGTLESPHIAPHPGWPELLRRFARAGGTAVLLSGRLPTGMTQVARLLDLAPGTLLAGADGATYAHLSDTYAAERGEVFALNHDTFGEIVSPHGGLLLTPERVIIGGAINEHMEHLAQITAPHLERCDTLNEAALRAGKDPIVGYRFLLPKVEGRALAHKLDLLDDVYYQLFDNKEFSNDFIGIAVRPMGADKGEALRQMASRFGVPMENTLAMGDWVTDIPMLEVAGHSFCPADALAMVRERTRKISEHTMASHWAYLALTTWMDRHL